MPSWFGCCPSDLAIQNSPGACKPGTAELRSCNHCLTSNRGAACVRMAFDTLLLVCKSLSSASLSSPRLAAQISHLLCPLPQPIGRLPLNDTHSKPTCCLFLEPGRCCPFPLQLCRQCSLHCTEAVPGSLDLCRSWIQKQLSHATV